MFLDNLQLTSSPRAKRCRQDSIPPKSPALRSASSSPWSRSPNPVHLNRACPPNQPPFPNPSEQAYPLQNATSRKPLQNFDPSDSRSRIARAYLDLPTTHCSRPPQNRSLHHRLHCSKLPGRRPFFCSRACTSLDPIGQTRHSPPVAGTYPQLCLCGLKSSCRSLSSHTCFKSQFLSTDSFLEYATKILGV